MSRTSHQYNRAPPDDMTLILKTTSKTIRPGKQLAQTAAKKEVGLLSPAAQTTKAAIKTVLVASYGWPTEAMQPSGKQSARR